MWTLLAQRCETLRRVAVAAGEPDTDEFIIRAPRGLTDFQIQWEFELRFQFPWASTTVPGWAVDAAEDDKEMFQRLVHWAVNERRARRERDMLMLSDALQRPPVWAAEREGG